MYKLRSRKFIVWIVWFGFSFVQLFSQIDLPKDIIFQFFGYVSMLYIGGNAFQKYAEKKKDDT